MQDQIIALFQDARHVALSSGETLFLSGQSINDVFLVRLGRVHLHRHTRHGACLVLQHAGPGTILAEASAYAEHYHCDAVAAEDSVVGALPKARFLDALGDVPMLARAWAGMLARGVQAARLRAEIRSLPKVADRLDAWLGEGNMLPEKGRWQEVAAELGVTREALYRELARRRTVARRA
jgi:CRP-like cAMP-binding protein